MRNQLGKALALALALGLGGCGSKATGIAVDIDPDPVEAVAQRDGSYVASWDAVVSNLNGVSGIVQSVEAEVAGASAVTSLAGTASAPQPSAGMAVEPFARRAFRQSARFRNDTGSAALAVRITVRFTTEDEQSYEATAQARIAVR